MQYDFYIIIIGSLIQKIKTTKYDLIVEVDTSPTSIIYTQVKKQYFYHPQFYCIVDFLMNPSYTTAWQQCEIHNGYLAQKDCKSVRVSGYKTKKISNAPVTQTKG